MTTSSSPASNTCRSEIRLTDLSLSTGSIVAAPAASNQINSCGRWSYIPIPARGLGAAAVATNASNSCDGRQAGRARLPARLALYALRCTRARLGRDPGSNDVLHGVRDQRGNDVLYGVQVLQMILASIEESEGTRRGVRDQVFNGAGITIAADRAILGKTISIDPATDDTNINDVTVLIVKDREETLVKTVST